jgi:hypothetical protein
VDAGSPQKMRPQKEKRAKADSIKTEFALETKVNAIMNRRLDDALTRVRTLPEEEQQAAADLLFEYLDAQAEGTWPTRAQIAEIERRLAANDIASDDEVAVFFNRVKG